MTTRAVVKLRHALDALHELQDYQAFLKRAPRATWHSSRCAACGQRMFLTLHYLVPNFQPAQSAALMRHGTTFELLDGFCVVCSDDSLWNKLCVLDPTRDEARAFAYPINYTGLGCPRCAQLCFNGMRRGNNWIGACNACHLSIVHESLRRRVRQNLAEMSRVRRYLNSRIDELTQEVVSG